MAEYIDREAFVESQHNIYCVNCNRRKDSKGKFVYFVGDAPCRSCGIMDVLDAVENLPAADVVERKKGKWLEDFNGFETIYRCSKCSEEPLTKYGTMHDYVLSEFCPNCGAEMLPTQMSET